MPTDVSPTIEGVQSSHSDPFLARLPIVPAESSDHVGVYCFLNSLFGEPTQAEFRASIEDPNYQPADRLLVKKGLRIVAHAQVLNRACRLGRLRVPAAQLDGLATDPRLQGQGLGMRLLRAAESRMIRNGALVGWAPARAPRLFSRLGWADFGRHRWSCSDAHRLLGTLMEQGFRLPSRRARLHVRPWLLWEVGSLARLYSQGMDGLIGPFQRSEAYWQWLVRRHAFEQLYVAIEGPELIDLDERKAPVVGYAATKGEQILELVTPHAKKGVADLLLARVCHDAVESGRRSVVLHAPEAEPLHEVFRKSGEPGRDCVPHCAEGIVARVLRPHALMRLMKHVLQERAVKAGLPPAWELGFRVGRKRYLISLADSQVTIAAGKKAKHTVELSRADFTRMLLGRIHWNRALAEARVVPEGSEAAHLARSLFPTLPFWKPPLDDLKRDGEDPY